MPFQCSSLVRALEGVESNFRHEAMPKSPLAKALINELQAAEVNQEVTYVGTQIDQVPDISEDEGDCPISGEEMIQAGKFKGKKTMSEAYTEDKTYINWVRAHINKTSAKEMIRLRLCGVSRREQDGAHAGDERNEKEQHEPDAKDTNAGSQAKDGSKKEPHSRRKWMGRAGEPVQHGHGGLGTGSRGDSRDHDTPRDERGNGQLREDGSHAPSRTCPKLQLGENNERGHVQTEEIEIVEKGLDKLVRRVKDSKERLDVLIINPNDESVDVAEIFSLPRVCKAAQQAGLKCGGSYDILNGWDLRVEGKRKELLRSLRPRLLIVCPPCGPFSQLQELNKMRNLKGYLQKLSEGKMLLRFAMELCKDQMDRGGFVFVRAPSRSQVME